MMNWNEMKKYANWQPLSLWNGNGIELDEDLFKIDENSFFFLVPYNKELIESEDGPYISMFIWAQSEQAIRRAYCQEIENDITLEEIEPPKEMLLETGSRTYREILKDVKTNKFGSWMETGNYRIVSDGKFIDKSIQVGSFIFHFRSNKENLEEIPYVISYSVK